MKQARLFTPGPTAVPAEVLEAESRPLVHHRTQTFRDALAEVMANLQYVLKTRNPVVVMASSGSGGMEAAVVNLTAPGQKVIVTEMGKFSERWSELCRTYGVDAVPVTAQWGQPVVASQVEAAFAAHPDARALFTTHSETSTAVLHDVATFARIAHAHDAVIAVDGITSIACHDVRTDEWGLDVVVGGSQKGVMIPPGLAYVSVSERARRKMAAGRHPSYYFDLERGVKKAAENDTAFTPAISLVFALQQALRMMREEGIEAIIARHAANAGAVRAAVTAMGLPLFSTASPSNACTAVVPPEGSAGEISKRMEHGYGVKIAGGQGLLKGKIVRLGHLGYYDAMDMYTLISAFESVCHELDVVKSFGAGINALHASFGTSRR